MHTVSSPLAVKGIRRLAAWLLAALCLLSLTACAARMPAEEPDAPPAGGDPDPVPEEPETPPPPETVTIDGAEFYPITVSQTLLDTLDGTEGLLPGERGEAAAEIKTLLREAGAFEFVAHSQVRPEVADLFDSHLTVLAETLYDFCGLQRETALDELTVQLLRALPDLPEGMQEDVYRVYKGRMIRQGIDGTLLRSGESPGLYYMAQTDPDWSDYPFPNPASPNEVNDTARNRSCGVMSMTMVASAYLHREVDPTELIDYVLDHGYRITASGIDDTFLPIAAGLYGLEEPTICYREPAEGQEALDWELVRTYIDEENALGIVHCFTGNFTSAQHYMVLYDYLEVEGTGYFLIADPYQLRSRYHQWGTAEMLDPELGDEGIICATPELLAQTSSAVTLFAPEKDAWPLARAAEEPAVIG